MQKDPQPEINKLKRNERNNLRIRFHGNSHDNSNIIAFENIIKSSIKQFQHFNIISSDTISENNFPRIIGERARSLFNACMLGLEMRQLPQKQQLLIQAELEEKYHRLLKDLTGDLGDSKAKLSWFTQALVDSLKTIYPDNDSQAIKRLQKLECYTTLEEGAASIATVSMLGDDYVIQIEETVPSLDGKLLREYEELKEGKKIPPWFDGLDLNEQDYLMAALKKADNVQDFFRTCPSTLRSLPMPANLRHHHFIVVDSKNLQVKKHYTQIRSGNIASRDAPNKDRDYHTDKNMEAIINQQPDKQFVLLQTLISPHVITSAMGKPDTKLHADVGRRAQTTQLLQDFLPEDEAKTIVVTNHPLNLIGKIVSSQPSQEVINFVTPHAKTDHLTQEALTIYQDKHYPFSSNLMMASLEQIMVFQAGGLVHSACMSGKDRNGALLLHTDTLKAYFETHGELPKTPQAKHQFNLMFVEMFKTRHQQEAAGQNTIGCAGIKEIKTVLPEDILQAIKSDPEANAILQSSNDLAKTNNIKEITSIRAQEPNNDPNTYRTEALKILNAIVHEDEYWQQQGKGLFSTKVPRGIQDIQCVLNEIPPQPGRQYNSIKEIVRSKEPEKNPNKNRQSDTQDLYNILLKHDCPSEALTQELRDFQNKIPKAKHEMSPRSMEQKK